MKTRYRLTEICEKLQVEPPFIVRTVHEQWIEPAEPGTEVFDEEDLARLRLILELKSDFGVNDEAIPIILHLLDQLYALRAHLKRAG